MTGIIGPGTQGSNAGAQTFLTNTGETGSLPNSVIVMPGENITFDDSVPNQITLNATQAGFGNPTASIGMSVVNGVATTAMRSDAAAALSASITPTWTGQHTFTAAIGLEVESAAPRLLLDETDAPSNERLYDFASIGGQLRGRLRTDADGAGSSWFVVDRTGTTIDTLSLAGTTINLAGALAMPSGSGASTGTSTATFVATNKLGSTTATGPAIWLPITVNGTAYVMPLWAL